MAKKKLSEKEFADEFGGEPWDFEELASVVDDEVKDGEELKELAKQFLEARSKFWNKLEEIGYEFG